jgi:hypothetical protein
VTVHIPDTQAAAPFESPAHCRQALPHAVGLLSSAQLSPQRW